MCRRTVPAILVAWLLAGVAQLVAQQTQAPQRTIVSRPEGPAATDQKTEAGGPSTASLEQYRKMWEKMTPAQQKAFIDSGGYTPEQYERMLKQRGAPEPAKGATGAAAQSRNDAGAGAFDTLSQSLRDLNAIRDANLSRVQKDGCPPAIASRIADLKGKLQNDEFELNGRESLPPASTDRKSQEKSGAADPLALAADWFKRPAGREGATAAPSTTSGSSREAQLLEAALNGSGPAATAQPGNVLKSPEAEQARKTIQEDMVRIKAELAELSGACASSKP
jgi:hypothetical protein